MKPILSQPGELRAAAPGTQPKQEMPDGFAGLRRFARTREATECCELCGSGLGNEHPHLLNRQSRQIACSCDGCAILFCGQEGARFLRIPRRILALKNIGFGELEWEALMLPINLAFFLREREGSTKVWYPSPAGAMSSLLGLPDWEVLFDQALLPSIEPEVEALLVNRMGKDAMYFVAPLDECYRLVGLIRTKWRGLSGGAELWQAVNEFFSSLERRATAVGEVTHARA